MYVKRFVACPNNIFLTIFTFLEKLYGVFQSSSLIIVTPYWVSNIGLGGGETIRGGLRPADQGPVPVGQDRRSGEAQYFQTSRIYS